MAKYSKESWWAADSPAEFQPDKFNAGWTYHRTLCGYGEKCLWVSEWMNTEAGAFNEVKRHMATVHGTIPT